MRIDYYKKEFFEEAKEQRKKALIGYFTIAGAFLLISVALLWWYSTLTYMHKLIGVIKAIHYVILAVFVFVSGVYLGIKFKRVNKYYNKCIDIQTGLTETSFGNFIECSESLQTKDGVDFKSLTFLELNKKKDNFFERNVLVFYEKPFPDIKAGQNVRYTTQGNVLKYYEIIEEQGEQK